MTSRCQGLFPPTQFKREKPWERGWPHPSWGWGGWREVWGHQPPQKISAIFVAFFNRLPTCCCVVHTHQFEFVNTSWLTFICRLKAALKSCRPIRVFTIIAHLRPINSSSQVSFGRLTLKSIDKVATSFVPVNADRN